MPVMSGFRVAEVVNGSSQEVQMGHQRCYRL